MTSAAAAGTLKWQIVIKLQQLVGLSGRRTCCGTKTEGCAGCWENVPCAWGEVGATHGF